MADLTSYKDEGLSILIPPKFKVVSPSPQFQAIQRSNSITLLLDPADALWTGWQRALRHPMVGNRDLESRIVREGRVDTPLVGYERVIEHFGRATAEYDFAWMILLESGADRAILQISVLAPFAEQEEMWTKVVRSLCITKVA